MHDSREQRLSELMASRLCHDLVGPIGAISNGLELMAEDEDMAEEALELTARSAKQASSVLQYARYAYGDAGYRGLRSLNEIKDLMEPYLETESIELSLEGEAGDLPSGTGKLLLNLLGLAAEALPRGGTITLVVSDGAQGLSATVRAEGKLLMLSEEAHAALRTELPEDEISPRNVHVHYTQLLAGRLQGRLTVEGGTGRDGVLALSAVFPPKEG